MRTRSLTPWMCAALLSAFAAACSNSNNNSGGSTPTTPSCTVTAAAASTTFAAAGGSGTVTVTTGSGCAWTATSSASFVTITAGATGSGNGSVTYTVAANTGAARTATLTVAGTTFTISQSAGSAPAPTGTLSAPTANSPTGGASVPNGNPTLVVNNAAATGSVGPVSYRFEVSDQPTFPNDPVRTFTVDGVAQGSGSTTSWTVTRTLGNDVLWYWHARATNGVATTDYSPTETFRTPTSCTVSVPATINTSAAAGTANIAVTASTTSCAWTATSNASFITITSGASGSGGGTIAIAIAANTTGAPRNGTISVNNQTVTVSQSGTLITAAFELHDPGLSGAAPVTTCNITSNIATTCTLVSTSFALGTNTLVRYDWTASFFDGQTRSFSQTGSSSTFNFVWSCGGPNSSAPPGTAQPLSVTLTVTDDSGNSVTVSAGSGSQPPLTVTLFKC